MKKRISENEFDEAVQRVVEEMVGDEDLKGMAKLMVPLTGSMFAKKMKKVLFGEKEE